MKLTSYQKEMIATLRTKNYGYAVIATKMGLKRDQVRDYCRRNGLTGYKGEGSKPEKPLFCKHCGKEFRLSESGTASRNSRTYCSDKCKNEFWEVERIRNVIGKTAYCLECGEGYVITNQWTSPMFCSIQCRENTDRKKRYAEKLVYLKVCEHCGNEYVTTKVGQRYCSPACDVITTTCKECGKEFKHKRYRGERVYCSIECQTKSRKRDSKKSHEEYCEQFTKIHKWKIVPITQYNGSEKDLTVRCFECGRETTRKAGLFIHQGKRRGCQYCCKQLSTTENVIEDWLIDNGLKYIRQYQDGDLGHNGRLRFDFAILDESENIKMLIEYNGIQHYKKVDYFGGGDTLEKQQARDKLKRVYSKKTGVPLLEISYKQKHKLNEILTATLL